MIRLIKYTLLVISLLFINSFIADKSFADTLKLTLKELGAAQNVDLKTVKTYRDFYFTLPENWKVLPTSNIVLVFQHSPQLLPERSSINISINDEVIKTIKLTPSNVTKSTVSIAIPQNLLKDYNKLTFDVDQHYTYKCEDPFDGALWTTLLNDSTVVLNYTKQTPKMDFALYPYPMFDPLGYGATGLNNIISNPAALSESTLKAMAIINANLSQYVNWKQLVVSVLNAESINQGGNLILTGTPKENSTISKYANLLPFKVQNNKFYDSSGQLIPDDYGVLMMIANPAHAGSVVLIVSGNSPAGVVKAATVLTQKPTSGILKGNKIIVKEIFPNNLANSRDWPGYVTTKQPRLVDLNLDSQTVRGVTSLPITFNINFIPDISLPPKNFATMNLVYSYAANLDPGMSKLEVILNGTSLHSFKLDNTDGENLKTVQLQIPTESFKTNNELKFLYHIFPFKHDNCKFSTDRHVWGTIHNTTGLSLPAQIRTIIPDMGVINDGGYPFTAYQDLQDDVFVLPDDASNVDIYGMLWVVCRLAKMTSLTEGINLNVVKASSVTNEIKSSKNLIVIGTAKRNKFLNDLKTELKVIYDENKFTLFKKNKDKLTALKSIPNLGIVEQLLNPWKDTRVVMVLYGLDDNGLLNAISLFSNDNKFKAIKEGNIVAVADNTVDTLTTLNKSQAKYLYGEQTERVATTGDFWLGIIKTFLIIVGILALLKIFFGAFIKGGARRQYK